MTGNKVEQVYTRSALLFGARSKFDFFNHLEGVLRQVFGPARFSFLSFPDPPGDPTLEYSNHPALLMAERFAEPDRDPFIQELRRLGMAERPRAGETAVLLEAGDRKLPVVLTVPLRESGKKIGSIFFHEPVSLNDDGQGEEADLGEFIIEQAALAYSMVCDRESLRQQLDRSAAKLEAITCIGELIGSLDLEVLLARLLEISLFISGAQVGSVLLREDARIASRVEWGLTIENALKLRFAGGEPIFERALRTGEPQFIQNYQDRERYTEVEGINVRSYLCVPLSSKGVVLGAINLINSESAEGQFTEADQDSILTIAGLAATAIENALLHQVSLEKERISANLRIAQSIQAGMYPEEKPLVPEYEIAWINSSCDETGGDYFDFIQPDPDSLLLVIGDVSGHGIGSALLMAAGRATLRALCSVKRDLPDVVESLNRLLEQDMDEERFMTLFLGRLDPARHKLEFVNAGHDPPILLSASEGRLRDLTATGLPLGIFPEGRYETGSVEGFEPGDILLLTTDGVWEAASPSRGRYGKKRLKETFVSCLGLSPPELLAAIHRDVIQFVGGDRFLDDMTMVAIQRVA